MGAKYGPLIWHGREIYTYMYTIYIYIDICAYIYIHIHICTEGPMVLIFKLWIHGLSGFRLDRRAGTGLMAGS